jgi:glycosyltransferase involved in cell wall biosynthesis
LKIIIIFIFLIVIILFLYLFWLQINIEKEEKFAPNKKEVEKEEKKNDIKEVQNKQSNKTNNKLQEIIDFESSLRKIEENEIKDFRLLNSENILFDKIKYKKSDNPDITVVLTMFNQAHCIHKALRSIQNQSLKNIEILVNIDCSNDNSTETIQKYMEEDERIVMVNHDTIEGIMKIRSEGIKLAKGKYITAIDGDDAFIHKDILYNSLQVANIGNLDIVEFYGPLYKDGKFLGNIHAHRDTEGIIYQPELRTKFFRINEEHDSYRPITCRTIWGKIVKNEIFKKAIDNIGTKYTEDYIRGYEDTMMTVSLYQVAQSFYLMKQVGLYYSRDDKMGRFPILKEKKCIVRENVIRGLDGLKFLHFLMDKLKDNELEKQTIYHEMISINSYDYSNYLKHVDHNYEMLYSILDELYKSQYITENEKSKIIKIKTEVKDKEAKLKLNSTQINK